MTDTSTQLENLFVNDFWLRDLGAIEADLARYRSEAPITFLEEPEIIPGSPMPQGPGSWVATRLADITEISRDPKLYSSAQGIALVDIPAEFNEFLNSMIVMDDPRHARLRRVVSAGFTPRILARLEDSVQSVAATIVDEVCERGEVDFVVDVAAALPLRIVCELMGIPDSYYEQVFGCSNVILGASDPEYNPEGTDIVTAIINAGVTLATIMGEVSESKRGTDATDLTSILVNAKMEGDELTPTDIASFFTLLVVAGNETTRNAIAWGLKFLTDNPDQRSIWMNDFDAVAPSAVEEIVRYASPVTFMRRTLTADTVLSGVELAEGDKICMHYLAANRDESVFEDPYRFDVRRTPNNHVGFGGPGPHFCLGAHLARREITVMFRELFDRLPDIEAGTPDVLTSSFIHGVKHLPARFSPVAPRSAR